MDEFEEVRLLRLQPGDVLVFKLPGRVSQDRWHRLRKHLDTLFPGHEVRAIVLEDGADLEVVREEAS